LISKDNGQLEGFPVKTEAGASQSLSISYTVNFRRAFTASADSDVQALKAILQMPCIWSGIRAAGDLESCGSHPALWYRAAIPAASHRLLSCLLI